MRYISRFKNSIRASSVYSLAFMLTFALAAGLTTYEEAAAQPSIKLSVSPDDSIEEDDTGISITLTAQASAGFADGTSVVLVTLGGSAVRDEDTTFEMGDDYRITSPNFNDDGKLAITINTASDIGGNNVPNSSGSITLSITMNDDGAFERPETIEISGALAGSFVTGTSIEVLDDDYDVTLTAEVTGGATISENAAEPESVEVTALLPSTRTSPTTVNLNFSGTASSSYYTAAGTHSITIAAGSTTNSSTVTIDPNDNDTYGGDKTIIVGGTSGNLQVKPAPAVSISDNEEMPNVKLSLDPTSITEDAGLTRVTAAAELDGAALESTLTVKLNVVATDAAPDPSTASSDDYDLGGTQSISISAGSKSGSTVLLFTPNDDPRFEGDVNEIVAIVTDSGDMIDMEGRATITIVENDFDLVLSLDTSMVSEDSDDPVELELTATLQGGDRTNELNIPLVLGIVPTGYTVTINDAADPSEVDDSITIDAGDLTGTATVTVTSTNNDDVYSGNMTVDITANADGINDKGATITMVEDEAKPTITLSAVPTTLVEGTGVDAVSTSEITATLSGTHTGTVTVALSFSGTAEKGADKDYVEPTGQTISISGGTTGSTSVDFGLVDDEAFEHNETIVVAGTSTPGLDVSPVMLMVEDDDFDVELSIPATTFSEAVEDAQSVVVTATLQSARTSPLTIALNFSGSASSSEYVLGGTTTITVPPGDVNTTGTATITIDPVDNALRGGDKTIMVGGTASGVNLKAATNAITIMDDETAPTVAIKLSPDKLNEDAGTVSVTVTAEVSGGDPLASAATIELTVEPDGDAADSGTTMANEDDFSVTGTKSITIPAGAKSGSTTLSFAVVDDPLFEMSETITISASTEAPVADGDTQTDANIAATSLTIVDNDFDIKMSVDISSIAEDSADPVTVTVTATLTGSRTGDVPVVVAYQDGGGAVVSGDIASGGASITIEAGSMSGEAEVAIDPALMNNDGYEGPRTINVVGTSAGYSIQNTTITIADDEEKPTVKLSVDNSNVNEDGTGSPVNITATLEPNPLTADTEITLELGGTAVSEDGDTATEDEFDYNPPDPLPTLNVLGGESTGQVSLSLGPVNDNEFEATKTIIVSGKSNDVASIEPITINLLNNDFDVSISVPDAATVNENAADPESVVVTAMLEAAKTSPVTVQLVFGGTASPSDYTVGGTTTITLGAGVLSGTATVTFDPADNDVRGGDKTITVTGMIAGSDLNIQAAANSIALVDDEEAPTVTIKLAPDKLNEDAGAASVVVTAELSGGDPLAANATITLKVDPSEAGATGGMTANKDDFSVRGNLEIVIPAGRESASTTLTVDIVDDPLYEQAETITVSASTDAPVADADTDVQIADKTITIVDNDFDLKITVSPTSIKEGGDATSDDPNNTTVTVTASLTGTRTSPIEVSIGYTAAYDNDQNLQGNVATGGASITIPAGSMSANTEVTINTTSIHNATYEGDRTIDVTGMATILNIQDATITITDDEVKPTVKLAVDMSSIEESFQGTIQVTATLEPNGLTAAATTIELELGGTAVREDEEEAAGYANRDYSSSNVGTINIGANSTTGTGSVSIAGNDDSMFESTKTIIVSGKSSAVASIESATIMFLNNDFDVELSIPATIADGSNNPMSVAENAEDPVSIVIQAMLQAARTSPITVQLTFGGTEASRYVVGGTTTITLGAGVTTSTATVTIAPNDNDLRGGDKEIEVGGTVAGTDLNVQSAQAKITITDNEPAAVLTLKSDPESISEGASATNVTMTAELNVGMEAAATIALSIDGSSTAEGDGADYSASELMSITIPVGAESASSSFTITPVDDNLHEDPDETIVVSGSGGGLSGMATITILGNDYDIRLSSDTAEVAEGDDATDVVITAELFGGARTTDVMVNLAVSSDSPTSRFTHNIGAVVNGDIAATADNTNVLTIPAGSTTGMLTITIDPNADDDAFSGDKDITIVGATDDDQNVKSTKVLLRDAQRSMVTLAVDVDEIMEAGAMATDVVVTASLTEPLPAETVVTLAKSGSAEKGVDYDVTGEGTITIASGETEGMTTLTITPIDDLMYEGEDGETIVVGGSANGNLRVHTASITLVDNNMIPLASFTVDPVEINEGGGATEVTITAILGGTSGEEIEIGLSKPGSAIIGEDFMVTVAEDAAAFVIAVDDTMMSKTVTITPVDDMLYEGDEIINVTGTTMIDMEAYGDPMVADITLVDNDPAPMISLAVDVDTIAEDGGPQDVTITATATSASAVDIPITLSKPGTAVIGEDFTVSSEQEDFIIVDR